MANAITPIIPGNIFLADHILANANTGVIVIGKNRGPSGGSGIARDSTVALKKAISESVDRRSLMVAKGLGRKVPFFNLIKQEVVFSELKAISFTDSDSAYVDTTGTAAHSSARMAINNAIVELIQKNSIFLFWYCHRGYLLRKHLIRSQIRPSDFDNIYFICETSFKPLYSVCCIYDYGNRIQVGSGSDLNIKRAMMKSYNELLMEMFQDKTNHYINVNQHDYESSDQCMRNYGIGLLHELEIYSDITGMKSDSVESNNWVMLLPKWIENLYVTFLPNSLYSSLFVVRASSPELFMHIPVKKAILKSKKYENMPVNITESDIKKTPDCPID